MPLPNNGLLSPVRAQVVGAAQRIFIAGEGASRRGSSRSRFEMRLGSPNVLKTLHLRHE
jgi:hypothetical protein